MSDNSAIKQARDLRESMEIANLTTALKNGGVYTIAWWYWLPDYIDGLQRTVEHIREFPKEATT